MDKFPTALLGYRQVTVPDNFWLYPNYRGGVEKRVGWWGFFGYWYVVVFRDGTRTEPRWGTNNAEGIPSGKET